MRQVVFTALLMIPLLVWGRTNYQGYSGAPGSSGTCAGTCHGSGGGSVVVSGFPEAYTPNETYLLTIEKLSGSSISQFNGSCRIGNGSENAGVLAAGNGSSTYNVSGETNGIRLSSTNRNSAEFQWTAPEAGTGDVTLYIAAHQGNFSGANTVLELTATELAANQPPQAFERLLPADSSTLSWLDQQQIEFVWSSSVDPDGDEVTYLFEAWAQNQLVSLQPSEMSTTDTSITVDMGIPVEALDDVETILWTVRATDGNDTVDALNGTGSFTLDYPGDAKEPAIMPQEYSLGAYPNPFNPATTVQLAVPISGVVELSVYDIQGRLVRTLAKQQMQAGGYEFEFNGAALASGLYFVRMNAAGLSQTMKLVLMK